MNLNRIRELIERQPGVSAWQLLHVAQDETTVIRLPLLFSPQFDVSPNPHPREVISTPSESAWVTLYCGTSSDGKTWLGDALGQLTSDREEDVKPVLEGIAAAARVQRNQPFALPDSKETYPEVELADPAIATLSQKDLVEQAQLFNERMLKAAAGLDHVDVSNLELFLRRFDRTFLSSSGINHAQRSTRVEAEVCFLARPDSGHAGEHTARVQARRIADLVPEQIAAEYGPAARAIALAGPAREFSGPVILEGEACADFLDLAKNPLGFHCIARFVHEKASRYEPGKPVHEGQLAGDRLNLVSDPLISFGLRSAALDERDGTTCRRVSLAKDGCFDELVGLRRYFAYLGLSRPSGATGNTVIPAGRRPLTELTGGDCVVIRAFSDLHVDGASGEYAVEVRLGERRMDGAAEPFKGGLFVGNWFRSIADAHYSQETQVRSGFYGPLAVRLNAATLAA